MATGSALGAVARVGLADLLPADSALPWATLLANALGSFLIGVYGTLSGPDGRLFPRPAARQFVMDGFCGGFTTFSIFSLEAIRLVEAGAGALAAMYVLLSVIVWLAGVWAGYQFARRVNRLGGA